MAEKLDLQSVTRSKAPACKSAGEAACAAENDKLLWKTFQPRVVAVQAGVHSNKAVKTADVLDLKLVPGEWPRCL